MQGDSLRGVERAEFAPSCWWERSDDAGGSADARRSTPISYDDPPGSLRSPVPLERGTDSTADLRRPTLITDDDPPGSFCSPVPLERGTDSTASLQFPFQGGSADVRRPGLITADVRARSIRRHGVRGPSAARRPPMAGPSAM